MSVVPTSLVVSLLAAALALGQGALSWSGVQTSPTTPASVALVGSVEAGEPSPTADVVLDAPTVRGESVQQLKAEGVWAPAKAQTKALAKAVEPEVAAPSASTQEQLPARQVAAQLAVLTPIREVKDFVAAGVSWLPRSKVTVTEASIRIRERGVWGPWRVLEQAEENASGGSGRVGTQPLISEGADAVQARILTSDGRAPGDVKITTVNGGSSSQSAVRTASANLAAYRPMSVGGDAMKPSGIVSRAKWGADEKLADTTTQRSVKLRAMYVHHTVATNTYSREQAAKIVRSYFLYHIKGNGWDDMGYHFLIDRFGTIYEGRRGAMNDLVIGAQAGGFNTSSLGVALIGNFESGKPEPAMLESLKRVLAWKGYANGIDVQGKTTLTANVSGKSTSRYKDGTRVVTPTLMGHRETNNTACPGKHVVALLPTLRTEVAAMISAGAQEHGTAGSPLKAPVAVGSYPKNSTLVTNGKVTLKWKKVGYAAKYQMMEREVGQKDAFSRNGFWSAGATTTALSKAITVKPGVTQVLGVRAIDKQGRPGPVTRFVQLTRPVSASASAVKLDQAKLGGKLAGASNGKGWLLQKKGASLSALSVVGADRFGITVQAPRGVTLKIYQGTTLAKTIKIPASKAWKTVYAALPTRGRNNVKVVASSLPTKASSTVKNLGFLRPRFAPEASTFVAPSPGKVTVKPFASTNAAGLASSTTASAITFAWNARNDAASYVVQAQRTTAEGRVSGWAKVAQGSGLSARVSLAEGEKVRFRVAAVSVFGATGAWTTSAVVERAPSVVQPTQPGSPTPTPSVTPPASTKAPASPANLT